jgi:hypothetical protein
MMAGRPYHRERASAAPLEYVLDTLNRGACRKPRDVVRIGRRVGVRVERSGFARGLGNECDVLAIVNACELVLGGSARLAHLDAALPEFGRDHLHDLGALKTLGVAWRIQMIREPVTCVDRQTHRWAR